MSGLKNFFRKNTKHENNQQIVTPQRRSSSDENFDDEELYEAVDLEQESAPYRPCSADDCDQWSENEFEDDEDIYTNDSELLQTPVVEIPKTPEAPILPPRSRGQPQIDHSIPSTTNLPPRIPDYRPAALSQQDSEDTADYYEEFSEESNRILHSNVDEDSDREDYETVNSEVVSKRPSPLPTPRRSPAPEPIPSLPPRSNRPGLPQPTIQAQILEETYVDNNMTSARQDGGLFSKMASALKQNLLNLSSRSTNSKQAEVPDEPCIYEVEDTPPIPQKYPSPQTSSRPLPESPKIESPKFEEMYEVTSDLPVVPSAPKPSAKDKVTPGPRKLSPVPPVPSDRFVGFKAESLSKRAKQKLPEPDPEDDICNYELENDSPPPSTTKIIPTKPKTPAIVQNEKQKSMESEPAFPKHRLVPYTPVIPKGKGVSDPDGQPKSSFLMKNLPSKNGIPSSECNAVKKDNSDMTSSGDSKPAVGSLTCIVPNKNKYLKPITPKIQIQRASESDESNLLEKSNKPTKGNYPRHIPPKLQVPKTDIIDSKKGKDETLISSNTSKVLDASMNCLEENKDKKRTSEFSSKSSNHQIAPLIQEPRNKGVHRKPLLTPESKTQKDFPETQTSAVDKKIASNDLDDSSWYMPDATREDSDKKLKFIGKDGAFLIRKSQRGASLTPYSMSVFQSGRIFNLQIRKRSDNKYAIGSEKVDEKTFTSLSDLVSFHENSPIEIMGGGAKVYLKHPANK